MPGFDGTGPMGMGPMTGGGRGFCAAPASGIRPQAYGGRPLGRGGRGGRGRRNWYYATGFTGLQDAEMLKNQAELLKAELDEILKRLALLEQK